MPHKSECGRRRGRDFLIMRMKTKLNANGVPERDSLLTEDSKPVKVETEEVLTSTCWRCLSDQWDAIDVS